MKPLLILAFAVCVAAPAVLGDEPKTPSATPTPATKVQRMHHPLRNADPVLLAEVVGKHFKGDAEILAVPAGAGNAVLVSGSPGAVTEVLKLLETLDRKPRIIEVEVTIAELPAPREGNPVSDTDLAMAESLVKDGKGQKFKLRSVEGQQVSTTVGGNKPLVSGSSTPGGPGRPAPQRAINYHAVGTTLRMTPRIVQDGTISLDLSVQESKVRPTDDDIGAPSIDNNSLSARLLVPTGKAVVAQTVRSEGKPSPTVSVVIVAARPVEEK